VSEAESLGTLKHLSTTATDVTGQVADLGAQVSALEAARTQLEALFARAGTIQALLSVQNEITSCKARSNNSRHNNAFSRTRSASRA